MHERDQVEIDQPGYKIQGLASTNAHTPVRTAEIWEKVFVHIYWFPESIFIIKQR